MCSIQPPTSWSPRFPSRHSRSCLTLKSPLSFTLLIALTAFLSRKWSEQLNRQNQPFPPGRRQPPLPGNRWRGRDFIQNSPIDQMINPQIMFKYQQLIKENLSEIAKLITVEQVFLSSLYSVKKMNDFPGQNTPRRRGRCDERPTGKSALETSSWHLWKSPGG